MMPSISLCMIVKNEEQLLASCLESVKELVQEMIVVDTGSSDKTVEIAASFGAKIFSFHWCDDFAAARNESLKHAAQQWILVLDADEILDEENRDKIKQVLEQASEKKYVGFGIISRHFTNIIDEIGWQKNKYMFTANALPLLTKFKGFYDDKWKTRLFLNNKHIFYQGKIHEDVNPSIELWHSKEPSKLIANTGIVIHHLHAMKNTDVVQEKQRKYFELTKSEINIHPSKKLYVDLAVGYIYFEAQLAKALHALLQALLQDNEYNRLTNQEQGMLTKYIHENDTSNAFSLLLNKLNYNDLDYNVLLNLAKACFFRELYPETEVILQTLSSQVKVLAQDRYLHELLGVTYAKQEKNREAITVFNGLHQKYLKNSQYIFNLAALYEKIKDYDNAIIMFSKLLELKHPQANEIRQRIEVLKKIR